MNVTQKDYTYAEYIWIDGQLPTAKLRSKTKVLREDFDNPPVWGFDGSSTQQAEGIDSDCVLQPVKIYPDPIRGGESKLVLCEVMLADGSAHESNTRARLRDMSEKHTAHDCIFGIEQEYTFFEGNHPLGWPDGGFPAPQGNYYCGIGADEVFGREIVEDHMEACLEAGIHIEGINAEVMPSQWEFQVGPVEGLPVSDDLWMARWLLYRIAEDYGVNAKLHPKPIAGDWNGAGAHTNFSTKEMRESLEACWEATRKLEARADEHIEVYGDLINLRLTGLHETCDYRSFRAGVSDRGASVRIPWHVNKAGKGYIEDRRPNANMDPYQVCAIMMETICGS